MYEYISGKIVDIKEEYVVLENNGIGYKIFTSKNCIGNIDDNMDDITMYVYLNIREDEMSLYGFNTYEELDMFKLLLLVSKIGPKIAVGILSVLTPKDIKLAILNNDIQILCRAPGVGKKTANRIILELKDRIDDNINIEENYAPTKTNNYNEALYGLLSLGYTRNEIVGVLSKIDTDKRNTEDIIRLALKKLSKK